MPSAFRRGFTLIELLIVVVIIGVLAAIAIPKFSDTKRKAQVAAIKSALRRSMMEAESHFAANNSYVGLALTSSPPVMVGSNMAGIDLVNMEGWHTELPGVKCRVYLGSTDSWGYGDDGTILREGVIGGNSCK
jgi:prepilin-type N-terminal cleavage/methylation domain-containing protein